MLSVKLGNEEIFDYLLKQEGIDVSEKEYKLAEIAYRTLTGKVLNASRDWEI